jgi:pimeloyl-ACP methyl ester carboxylesterase
VIADRNQPAETETIVLIHGLWVTRLIWERWTRRYRARGYRVLAPAWPGTGQAGASGRRPDPASCDRGVPEIANEYDHLIRKLQNPPVIIGHCVGGLITQILLERGLGAAGVAIAPAPARGAGAVPLLMRGAGLAALRHPRRRPETIALTPRQFHRGFAGTLSREESALAYERHCIPSPTRIVRQVGFANCAPRGDASTGSGLPRRVPLLLIASGKDHLFPPSITKSNLRRYARSGGTTAYRQFPEHSHYIIGEPGWEQVADYVLRWAMESSLAIPRG